MPVCAPDQPWRVSDGCVIVRVRVTPKSSVDTVTGVGATAEGPALLVKVRAAPAEGEANAAVERVVARWIGVAKGRVSVDRGAKSRVKQVTVEGDPDQLQGALRSEIAKLAG